MLFFWVLELPHRIGLITAWIVGLFVDVLHADPLGLNGLLLAAKKKNLQAALLDLRNSGDTAGSHDRVVGYGAYLIN